VAILLRQTYRALVPEALRVKIRKMIVQRRLGDYRFRLSIGAVERPNYAHLVLNAAQLASRLGYRKMSVLEYGVAGGNGLLALEYHAAEVEKLFPIEIEIYGFDTGKGLPAPKDYRDLPYHWREGFFHMEEDKLRQRLTRAKLVLGDIEQTARTFFERHDPAPIGAIIHDFDFYSSTAAGLRMLHAGERYYLPRVFCYFDDTIGDTVALYNDFTGQRLAINEFNAAQEHVKLGRAYYFGYPREVWHEQIWICHFFRHGRYNAFASVEDQQLRIEQN
jgi:hypothetical protein